MCGFQMQKILTWGGGLQCKGANFPPLWFHDENQLLRFQHRPLAPPPPPSLPFQADIPTPVIQF